MAHESLLAEIDEALPRARDTDRRPLEYVRTQLKSADERPEGYEDVKHLTVVAKERLRNIPPKKEESHDPEPA